MNQVTPHNKRPVDTTVGELEPGTIFRTEDVEEWQIRSYNKEASSMFPEDGVLRVGNLGLRVTEIADSVTIGPEVTSD
jgi:hypothetical protein